ncbi:MAG: hypothetical protein OXO54_06265 [Chloroflexota bacterium]|nr:hypothetical protein [Chloroflexota bacterium]MDE2897905.1 hypothetical protein [Chloroflexota bacterium]
MTAGETSADPGLEVSRLGHRMSRLEGAYEHLATKADLKDLELRLSLRVLSIVGIATGLIIAFDRLWS